MVFSWIGLLIALSILAPNLAALVWQPRNMPENLKDAHIVFTLLERLGQVACLLLSIFAPAASGSQSSGLWLALAVLCVVVYVSLWARYFAKSRDFRLLFQPLLFLPIPMAVFPVLAFAFAAVWLQSWWLGLAAALFAIGHLANSWHTYRRMVQ